MPKQKKRFGPVVLACLLALILAGTAYVNDFYRASDAAITALESTESVTVSASADRVVFRPEEAEAGLIFYPGGKVEFTAYAPLMQELARENVLCILLKMPLNLAVLDMNAAEGIREEYPEITRWYLGGHSLGGSMAAGHIAEEEGYEGLLLLAAYSTADLTDSGLRVLSIYGSLDGVLNPEKYDRYRPNLPEDFRELVIPGGNHANFGDYGAQDGDSTASLTGPEQWAVTAEAFAALLH